MSLFENPSGINIGSIASDASNIRTGTNPAYTNVDFLTFYPQFGQKSDQTYVVPLEVIDMYIGLANASIKEARWHESWKIAMGYFVAHFCTLWLQSYADPNGGAAKVIAAGQAMGLMASKSIGDVSVSYDFGTVAQDLESWASWKLTIFGQQLANIGKIVGKGNMYVY